jgi:hypothetical protein
MGRSLSTVTPDNAGAHLGTDGRARFSALGFDYLMERRDGRLFHRESFPVGEGQTDAVEAHVRYRLGSGTRGITFVTEEDGFLFQSPVSWYAAAAKWDLNPGYRERHAHFGRPVGAACLFCHCNQVEPVPGSVNRYTEPVFRGHAIGCERCHGPGEKHVQLREGNPVVELPDLTIVNPSARQHHATPRQHVGLPRGLRRTTTVRQHRARAFLNNILRAN